MPAPSPSAMGTVPTRGRPERHPRTTRPTRLRRSRALMRRPHEEFIVLVSLCQSERGAGRPRVGATPALGMPAAALTTLRRRSGSNDEAATENPETKRTEALPHDTPQQSGRGA